MCTGVDGADFDINGGESDRGRSFFLKLLLPLLVSLPLPLPLMEDAPVTTSWQA
jgi:hypothetical protein